MRKLIVIHGALGAAKEFNTMIPLLNKHFEVIPYELPHHGTKKNNRLSFNIDALTKDLLEFLASQEKCIIYGFSLGGYVALCAAQLDAKNIEGIITQGTKLDWSPEIAEKEIKSLDVSILKDKLPTFYEYLVGLHGEYLPDLLNKTASFMKELGENPALSESTLNKIDIPVRFTRGGKDRMVTEEETLKVAQHISNHSYFEIPFLPHPFGFIKPKYIARIIEVQAKSIDYKWCETKYGRIAYKLLGSVQSEKTCLLFLHDALGSIAQWNDFPSNLSAHLNLPGIMIEFPGYGFSDNDPQTRDHNYLHNFATKVLPAFIEKVCPKNNLIIVGHSDGGTNALLYAAKFPSNVKGIVTMAAHYINEKETRAGIETAIKAFEEGKLRGLELFHGNKTRHLFYNWARTWLAEDFKTWDISNDIRASKVPALVMQGYDDQYGTVEQVKGICSLLKNSEPYFIENCGHSPHREQTGIVINKIKQWSTNLR
jgi:pimeloyl-ACP methyl ester carboxylesterase